MRTGVGEANRSMGSKCCEDWSRGAKVAKTGVWGAKVARTGVGEQR